MDIPEGAYVPQDHLAPAEAPELDDDELLADMPELVAPHKLRLRQRNRVMKLALGLRSFVPEAADGEAVEFDTESLDDATLEKFLDVLADIDEFAESIAQDPAAYVAWSEGKDYDVFSALLSRYSSAVGESSSSSS